LVNGYLILMRALTFLAISAIALAGCSSGPVRGEVFGKVTFKGQPVKEGTVTFLNTKDGGGAEAEINSDGTYVVPRGVVAGEYDRVEIKPLMEMKDTDPGKTPPSKVEKSAPNIPAKYRMQGTTPLKATVKAGKNEINFEMTP
jgi:hypothetical protein